MDIETLVRNEPITPEEVERAIARARHERSEFIANALGKLFRRVRRPRKRATLPTRAVTC